MFDVVFLSYQEPDCEQRFLKLQKQIPFIKYTYPDLLENE